MHFEYETRRLNLKVLGESFAPEVLQFYLSGRRVFDAVESPKSISYYTFEYQSAALKGEYNAFLNGMYMRYFFFVKDEPDKIIGTASFSNIIRGAYHSCVLGYKLLPEYQKQGYALEAVSRLVTAVFEEEKLHRIEAYTLPDNINSISLLTRLGFEFESLAKSVLLLRSGYTDHRRYVLINPRDLKAKI